MMFFITRGVWFLYLQSVTPLEQSRRRSRALCLNCDGVSRKTGDAMRQYASVESDCTRSCCFFQKTSMKQAYTGFGLPTGAAIKGFTC